MADAPRVFLSYSHDSAEHADRVLALADALLAGGIDVILDRYVHPAPEEGWPRWMDWNLDQAKFVLMICTETYCRRVLGKGKPSKGLGVRWEGKLIYNRIYHNRPSGSRFIPILLPGVEPAHIPNPVQGYAYYRIATFDLTDSGFEALYRHLTNQPATPPPDRGKITILPPRPRPQPGAEEARLVYILDRLERSKDPEMVPVLFQCLAHPSDEVRRKAKAALDAFGWEAVIAAIEGLARRGDGERVGHILDGLEAFEAHPKVVDVLDRMMSSLQGAHRARAILLWERKSPWPHAGGDRGSVPQAAERLPHREGPGPGAFHLGVPRELRGEGPGRGDPDLTPGIRRPAPHPGPVPGLKHKMPPVQASELGPDP